MVGQDERRMAPFAQYAVAAAAEAIEDAGLQNLSKAEKEKVVRIPHSNVLDADNLVREYWLRDREFRGRGQHGARL
jgi:3-oxoacyl-(acyl-carrier-protein) synthase